MRILVVNEFVEGFGAEQVVRDQTKLLESKGYEVLQLCFGFKKGKKNNNNWIDERHVIITSPAFFKILFDIFFYIKIRRLIKSFSPDIIILHNVFSAPLSVYYACRNYYTVQIVHDYKILCPTSLGIKLNQNFKTCDGFKKERCIKCCSQGIKGFCTMILRLIQTAEGYYFRKKYIDKLLCPSQWLTDITRQYGFNSFRLNNLVASNLIESSKRSIVNLNLVSAGGLVFNKGVLQFAKKIIYKRNISLTIFGNRGNDEDYKKIIKITSKSDRRILYKGYIQHNQLMDAFSDFSFLVVPSLWMDNYPTIILEGMIRKICIIASDRGGAKELLADGRGFVFSWDDESTIDVILNKIAKISIDEYNAIVDKAYEYVISNNNAEQYYMQLKKHIII